MYEIKDATNRSIPLNDVIIGIKEVDPSSNNTKNWTNYEIIVQIIKENTSTHLWINTDSEIDRYATNIHLLEKKHWKLKK